MAEDQKVDLSGPLVTRSLFPVPSPYNVPVDDLLIGGASLGKRLFGLEVVSEALLAAHLCSYWLSA